MKIAEILLRVDFRNNQFIWIIRRFLYENYHVVARYNWCSHCQMNRLVNFVHFQTSVHAPFPLKINSLCSWFDAFDFRNSQQIDDVTVENIIVITI